MGYAVYEDIDARNQGVERWAGYGVPGICDMPTCTSEIFRGLDNKCETIYTYNQEDDTEEEQPGCQLFFCEDHGDHEAHMESNPKPDTAQWMLHLLTDESWAAWRNEFPVKVKQLQAVIPPV